MKIIHLIAATAALSFAPAMAFAQTSGSDTPVRNISPSQPSDLRTRNGETTGTIPRRARSMDSDSTRGATSRGPAANPTGPTPEVGHQ